MCDLEYIQPQTSPGAITDTDKRGVKCVWLAAKAKLAADGYDPAYGARPLKRVMQRQLQDPLALAILQGQFNDGDTVRVDAKDDQLVFG